MAPATSPDNREISAEKTRLLYSAFPLTLISTVILASVLAFVHWPYTAWSKLLAWLIALGVLLALRSLLYGQYRRLARQTSAPDAWRRHYRLGVFATAIIWGVAGLWFTPSGNVALGIFTILLLAGAASGAVTVLAADFRACLAFLFPALMPVTLKALSVGDAFHLAIGGLLAFYALFLTFSSRQLNRAIDKSLRLRYQNLALTRKLASEKHRLDNRLGRILGNSASEIYIFDADSLQLQQASPAACRNLGSTNADLMQRRFLDFNPDLNRETLQRLAAPLYEGQVERVTFHSRQQRADGSLYPTEVRLQLARQETPPVFVATVDDLSEQLRNAELMKRQNTLLQSVISSAPIVIWALDQGGRYSLVEGNGRVEHPMSPLPRVGATPAETYADVPQITQDARRALRGEAFVNETAIGGNVYEIHYSPQRDGEGVLVGTIGVAIDVTDRKQYQQRLYWQANYDELTGLPNRALALERLAHAIRRAQRTRQGVALMILDIDNFKKINDTLGHRHGDQLLLEAGHRIEQCIRESDTVARLGGDEFLVLLEDTKQMASTEQVAEKVLSRFKQAFNAAGQEMSLSASIGITLYPDDGDSPEELLRNAETAMYKAKEKGKNLFHFFTPKMNRMAQQRLNIESRLLHALERNELQLHYQPKFLIQSGEMVGAEALLRWNSPELGLVSPASFIPVAEATGLIEPIGEWVLHEACRTASSWARHQGKPLQMAVNVSPRQFRSKKLLETMRQAVDQCKLDPGLLEIELTESLLIEDAPETIGIFSAFKEIGTSLALDDFGTGYASLSYLRKYPFDTLKIDQSFIRDLFVDPSAQQLCRAIIAMANGLKLKVVAEGVETLEQLQFLREQGVDMSQGYFCGRPVAAAEFHQQWIKPPRALCRAGLSPTVALPEPVLATD